MTAVEPLDDLELEETARPRHRLVAHFRRRPLALASVVYLVALVAVAVFAPVFAPHDPNRGDFLFILQSPGGDFLLGTDDLGRDVLSRMIFGARTSLIAATQVVVISTVLGTTLGLLAGYLGGKVDGLFSRINDALMSVPGLLLALALVAVLGPGLTNAMVALGIVFTPRCFRVVRAAAIDVRHQTFIEASIALGCRSRRVLLVHALPHVLSPLLVVISVSFGTAITAEAGLSYLGLGARPPTATWGGMLSEASKHLELRHLLYPPGIALVLTVTAFTILGDALRDALGSTGGKGDD